MLTIDQHSGSQQYRKLIGLAANGPQPSSAFPHECIGPGVQYVDAYIQRRGRTTVEPMWWGYVPAWSINNANARGNPWRVIPMEKAPGSGVFRHAWRNQRCLIPVDAFYVDDQNKLRYRVTLVGDAPMFLAGLWDFSRRGRNTTDEHRAFCILSCPAPSELQGICARMPLIIRPPAYDNWLNVSITEPADIARLAVPDMLSFAVTPYGWNDSHSRLARPVRIDSKKRGDGTKKEEGRAPAVTEPAGPDQAGRHISTPELP